jgi:hypothetical protein
MDKSECDFRIQLAEIFKEDIKYFKHETIVGLRYRGISLLSTAYKIYPTFSCQDINYT